MVHPHEEGPGQEASSSTELGGRRGHTWADSSGTADTEQRPAGAGPQGDTSPCPYGKQHCQKRAKQMTSRARGTSFPALREVLPVTVLFKCKKLSLNDLFQ